MPAEGEVGKLNISVGAKLDQLQKDLKKAEGMAKKTAKNIEKNKITIGGLAGTALKATAAFGTIELAMQSMNVASQAVQGNWEKAAEVIKKLPAGIGPAMAAIDVFIKDLLGINAAVEKIRKSTAIISRNAIQQTKERGAANKAATDASTRADDLRFENSIRGLKAVDQERRKIMRSTAREQENIADRIRFFETSFGGSAAIDALREQSSALAESTSARLAGLGGSGAATKSLGQGRQLGSLEAVSSVRAAGKSAAVAVLDQINNKMGRLVASANIINSGAP